MKLIFSQSEHPNFENFLGSMPQTPLDSFEPTLEFNLSLEKSEKSQGKSGNFIPSGD